MTRLDSPQPGERIDRAPHRPFTFDGKPVEAFAGDTIASALYAGGRRIFSRSFKYHRPRGEMDWAGQGANSLVQIDGAPGIRASSEVVREGMVVEHQNAWPSLDFDVMRMSDIAGGPFTPPGFYYKTFKWPRRAWPLYERALRGVAGLGRLPERQDDRLWRTEYRRRHCDVLVIGGGIAGLSPRSPRPARAPTSCSPTTTSSRAARCSPRAATSASVRWPTQARAAGVEILTKAPALGFYDGLVPVWQGDTLHQIRAKRHVAATGGIEQPLVFKDNDRPGVMMAGGARRLAALWAVQPGQHRGHRDDGRSRPRCRARAARGGVPDRRRRRPPPGLRRELGARVQAAGIRLLAGHDRRAGAGRKAVSGAVLARVDPSGKATGTLEEIPCDLLAVSGGTAPATSLLLQSGAKARYDAATSRFLAELGDGIVHAAGAVAGHEDADAAAASGTAAGLDAAVALGLGGANAKRALTNERKRLDALPPQSPVAAPPAYARDGRRGGKAFVDLDEDISAKDIAYAVAEGYDSIELSKRYTTVTMGPSQGRHSQLASIRVLAAVTGRSLDDVGITTARPPWSTVPMGALAGRPFEPAKRSAIHGRHRELGANVKWAGDWRRAYDYGDPEGEAKAVHDAAGLIDVSTLGKLLVRGPDAGAFLDRLYPNRVSNLKPGRIRYGVLTSETGRITDDGTIARLDDETFYVTTTSSGAGAVHNWFTWWLADWRMRVHITDVTQASAAMNLAGPRSREILQSLTDADLSADGMTYLDALPAQVAGVSCLVLRIGFTGELGYEIHCPAPHGQDLWDAVMQAGAEHGIRPFGLEPQRILRLQKLHILVGQDTDSESTPFGAAMPWIVKLDKEEDFIGRWALERAVEHPASTALVGFSLPDGDVPAEGAAVLDEGGAPIGQVTSARHSRQVGKVIGMAWVPSAQAEDGAQVTISYEGRTYDATVQTSPFHDPEGTLVRS